MGKKGQIIGSDENECPNCGSQLVPPSEEDSIEQGNWYCENCGFIEQETTRHLD